VSYGISNRAFKEITNLSGKPAEDTNILYIDTPANPYPKNPVWLSESKKELTDQGFNLNEYDLEEAFKKNWDVEKMVFKNDIVAVSGGNCFYFLYWAKKVNLKIILQKFLLSGGIFLGESAGVVCQIRDLTPLKWVDDPSAAPEIVNEGMRLTDLVVIPHWQSPKYKNVMEKVKVYYENIGIDPYLLKDGETMIMNEKDIKII
jgi:peptidase E